MRHLPRKRRESASDEPLPLSFYRRDALAVARDLLGRRLCRRLGDGTLLRGTLVEVEAYDGPDDQASHAHRGRTQRNAPMFEAGGLAYVYLIYGMHHCLNVVTGQAGYPAAILLRAATSPVPDRSASGPGRLCRVFQVDRGLDRASFTDEEVWLEAGEPVAGSDVLQTSRIGVDYAGSWAERPYRWVVRGHPDVSGPRRLR
jgi:DNA-3-methyladenine glycosylase